MRTTRAGPAIPLVVDRLRPAHNTCQSWICVWNDRLGGADLGKLPEQWRWERHQSGTTSRVVNWALRSHTQLLPWEANLWAATSIIWGWGGFDLFLDMSEVFLLKLAQLSVSGLETLQWSHIIHTFTLQEFYHVSWAKREKNSPNAGNSSPIPPNEHLPRSAYNCAWNWQCCLSENLRKAVWVIAKVWSKKSNCFSWCWL